MHSRVTPLASALRAIIVGLTVATASHAAMAATSEPATEQAPRQS